MSVSDKGNPGVRSIIEGLIREMYITKNVRDGFERYVHKNYIQHNPDTKDGREATIISIENFYRDNPDCQVDVKRILVDGDIGVTHSHIRRNASDPGLSVADFHRVENGLIVEHWDVLQPVPTNAIAAQPMF